ncbi:MAG: 1-acyl-sn-glycerol-3-phosphate acyltransferase [Caldilineales bacterium]|nr:1-acyl-sn-glycerol-3-phosphate acyltransferase [Caldilineales bacterium]MDW8318145.1 lysophospholipid acyltransferase family protein [Anaerolineae bacterium]
MSQTSLSMPRRVRFLRWLANFLLRLLTRLEVHGREKIPLTGAALFTMNHLHWLDVPIGLAIMPRPAVVFAAEKWERHPIIGPLMRWSKSTIFVARGEVDRRALGQALEVLKAGGMLGIAPEGTRSKTGALQPGREGPAYLASRTGAMIVPVAAWGQEKAIAALKRLRRQRIVVRVGDPFVLPGTPNKAKSEQLAAYTEEIMCRIAELLPPEYRGVYADAVRQRAKAAEPPQAVQEPMAAGAA